MTEIWNCLPRVPSKGKRRKLSFLRTQWNGVSGF